MFFKAYKGMGRVAWEHWHALRDLAAAKCPIIPDLPMYAGLLHVSKGTSHHHLIDVTLDEQTMWALCQAQGPAYIPLLSFVVVSPP